jgi:hypothetical protein
LCLDNGNTQARIFQSGGESTTDNPTADNYQIEIQRQIGVGGFMGYLGNEHFLK